MRTMFIQDLFNHQERLEFLEKREFVIKPKNGMLIAFKGQEPNEREFINKDKAEFQYSVEHVFARELKKKLLEL